MRSHPCQSLLLACAVAVPLLARPLLAQKADTLLLNNGDRIIGGIKLLENGLLEYKTDNIGTIKVKWDRVVQLTSRLYFEVETRGGRRHFGTFPRVDSAGVLAIALDRVALIPLEDVVTITQIKQAAFLDRIDGYLDLGFSYAKSNKTVQLTSGLEASYLLPSWGIYLKGDLFVQSQNQAEPTRRWSLDPSVQRQLAKRWLLYAQGKLQQNEELGLTLRGLISPGAGRAGLLGQPPGVSEPHGLRPGPGGRRPSHSLRGPEGLLHHPRVPELARQPPAEPRYPEIRLHDHAVPDVEVLTLTPAATAESSPASFRRYGSLPQSTPRPSWRLESS